MTRGPFIAEALRLGARGLGADAANTLLEDHPEIGERFDDGFSRWQDFLAQRLRELAPAIEFDAPQLFAHDAAWVLTTFDVRGVPRQDLIHAYEALRETIAGSLSPEDASAASRTMDLGVAALHEPPKQIERLTPGSPEADLAIRYLERAIAGDRRGAISLICETHDAGTPPLALYADVLISAQREVGVMWHLGEVSVPEEHAATDTTRSAMPVLAHRADHEPHNGKTVLVASTEGDTHDIGIRALADLLTLRGFRSVCLGANVPAEDLAQACEDFGADAVALSATMSTHLPGLAGAIELLTTRLGERRPRVLVGGPIFQIAPGLAKRIGADGEAATLSEALDRAEALAGAP